MIRSMQQTPALEYALLTDCVCSSSSCPMALKVRYSSNQVQQALYSTRQTYYLITADQDQPVPMHSPVWSYNSNKLYIPRRLQPFFRSSPTRIRPLYMYEPSLYVYHLFNRAQKEYVPVWAFAVCPYEKSSLYLSWALPIKADLDWLFTQNQKKRYILSCLGI